MKLLLHPSHIGWESRNRMPKEFRQCPVAFSQQLELDFGCFCFAVIICSLLMLLGRKEVLHKKDSKQHI